MAAYQAALNGEPVRASAHSRMQAGTIAAAVHGYLISLEFVSLGSETTKRTYRRALNAIARDFGDKPLRLLEAHHIKTIMASKIDTPAAANGFLRYMRMICQYAVERGWISRNPAIGIKKIKYDTEGFHTWSEEEIAQFEARWSVGTNERLAFDLLLYTGQRSADVRNMKRTAISSTEVNVVAERGEGADFKQQKTKVRLHIPIVPELARSLAAFPERTEHLILTSWGKPFTEKGFSNFVSEAANKAGLPQCSAHGLRKSAATRLAQAGCTEAQIMAITGHKTSAEVKRYTRAANQKLLAEDAMMMLSRARRQGK